MAVAFDASTESHTGTTGSTSEASFTFSHNPVGTPRGVLVYVISNQNDDLFTGVTYDGTSLIEMSEARANDPSGEPGSTKVYFLGDSIPTTDPAEIIVSRTNNSSEAYAVSITVTADFDTEVVGILLEEGNQALTEENISDDSIGANSLRFMGLHSGRAIVPPAGASSTIAQSIDYGDLTHAVYRETTSGQGSRPVGASDGVSDDVAAVYLAVREIIGVSFDRSDESGMSADVASFNWSHNSRGIPRGILVYVMGAPVADDIITGVTYDGTALTAVAGGFAQDTAGEPGFCKAYFLGISVPTTNPATVVVNRTNNSTQVYAVSISVLCSGNTEVAGILLEQENQAIAEENIDDDSPGFHSTRFLGQYHANATLLTAGSNSTTMETENFTNDHAATYRETIPGQGSRPVGVSTASSEDVAAVFLAVRKLLTVGHYAYPMRIAG